jgi:hypothetical protein
MDIVSFETTVPIITKGWVQNEIVVLNTLMQFMDSPRQQS